MKKVLISVLGGVAEVVACPADVVVEIRDYDNDHNLADFTADDVQAAIES